MFCAVDALITRSFNKDMMQGINPIISSLVLVIPITLYLMGNKALTDIVISIVNSSYVFILAMIKLIAIYFFERFLKVTFSDGLLLTLFLFLIGIAVLILKGIGFFDCTKEYKKDRLSSE